MEIALFEHMASKIDALDKKEDVLLLFKALAGEVQTSHIVNLLTDERLKGLARNFDNSQWKKAKSWKNGGPEKGICVSTVNKYLITRQADLKLTVLSNDMILKSVSSGT